MVVRHPVPGMSTWNSLPKAQNVYTTLAVALLFLAICLKHASSQSTSVCSTLEALATMSYINLHFTLHHIRCLSVTGRVYPTISSIGPFHPQFGQGHRLMLCLHRTHRQTGTTSLDLQKILNV